MAELFSRDRAISEIMQSLRRIFKAIQNYSQEVHNNFGITGPQLWILHTLSQNEGLSLSDLSRQMFLHPSTITGVVDRLEKKGYLARYRDLKDRRVILVQLTPQGKKIVRKAPHPIQGKMIYGLRKLKKGELKSIAESIGKLVELMEVADLRVRFLFHDE